MRSVEVKTATGTLSRAISKLFPLKIDGVYENPVVEELPPPEPETRARRAAAIRALHDFRRFMV